ncbi:ribokinase [Luteimonas sp. J16]|uniref:ribokinase n=1 Tax=unclassified Luteimonas TaxID=2629088 RepID=UPI00047DA7F0|nr:MULTISPECIES: ribokinase [unclassified Luteimonas]TWG94393.1 ribokinase [Luteimonas sp. J16]
MSAATHPRVVVVGSFNVDHAWQCDSLPRPGETRAGSYRTGPGGKGFNQATASARCGVDTVFVCALGDDDGGRLARTLAAADGIDLRAEDSPEPTGTAGIHVDAHGNNSIVIGPGANGVLSAEFVARQAEAISGARIVLAQLESPVESVLEAMRIARAAGVRTILNPAPANAQAPRELLAVADVLTPNETEFAALLAHHNSGRIDPADVAGADDGHLHDLCRTLLPRGTVVVTLGAAGAFVSHREDKCRGDELPFYRVPAYEAAVVDTTGAGDAFNGALAASQARGGEGGFIAHVRFAAHYAARSTEQPGAAVAMPRLPRQPEG